MTRAVLTVDVGGTHVKVWSAGRKTPLKIVSGPEMTAARMAKAVKLATRGWRYDALAIGYPGPVIHGRPLRDPVHLGGGWVGFDFRKAFGVPVRMTNDAALQALGAYRGGRMLFLGLGTGLGSAMIVDGALEPMELAHLPYKHGKTYEDYLGKRALRKDGKKKWRKHALRVAAELKDALQADEVVLGGGNAKKLGELPAGVRRGGNADALPGGLRLWDAAR